MNQHENFNRDYGDSMLESMRKLNEKKVTIKRVEFNDNSDNEAKDASKKYGIKIIVKNDMATISGDSKKIVSYLTGEYYNMETSEVKDEWPELF